MTDATEWFSSRVALPEEPILAGSRCHPQAGGGAALWGYPSSLPASAQAHAASSSARAAGGSAPMRRGGPIVQCVLGGKGWECWACRQQRVAAPHMAGRELRGVEGRGRVGKACPCPALPCPFASKLTQVQCMGSFRQGQCMQMLHLLQDNAVASRPQATHMDRVSNAQHTRHTSNTGLRLPACKCRTRCATRRPARMQRRNV